MSLSIDLQDESVGSLISSALKSVDGVELFARIWQYSEWYDHVLVERSRIDIKNAKHEAIWAACLFVHVILAYVLIGQTRAAIDLYLSSVSAVRQLALEEN